MSTSAGSLITFCSSIFITFSALFFYLSYCVLCPTEIWYRSFLFSIVLRNVWNCSDKFTHTFQNVLRRLFCTPFQYFLANSIWRSMFEGDFWAMLWWSAPFVLQWILYVEIIFCSELMFLFLWFHIAPSLFCFFHSEKLNEFYSQGRMLLAVT